MALSFGDDFRRGPMKRFGLRYREVEEAVSEPDQVHRIETPRVPGKPLTIYMKSREGARPPQHLLVIVGGEEPDRVSDVIPVPARWVEEDTTPLDALQKLCAECGKVVRVGDQEGSLIFDRMIQTRGADLQSLVNVPDVRPGEPWTVHFWATPLPTGETHISVAYALNPKAIQKALHG